MYKLELKIFEGSTTHQFRGGANLISAVPGSGPNDSPHSHQYQPKSALRSVPKELRSASLALGATKIQTIFQVVLPAAKSGIITAIVLGTGRAIGEAMAISLVSGSSAQFPASLQLRPLPYDGDRIGNVLLGRSSQTGALYHWSCPVRIYYDH